MANHEVELGDVAKDKVTGFQGVVIGITDWLFGCRRFTLQPQVDKDGKVRDSMSFDEDSVILVKKDAVKSKNRDTGGPRQDPVRAFSTPARR